MGGSFTDDEAGRVRFIVVAFISLHMLTGLQAPRPSPSPSPSQLDSIDRSRSQGNMDILKDGRRCSGGAGTLWSSSHCRIGNGKMHCAFPSTSPYLTSYLSLRSSN